MTFWDGDLCSEQRCAISGKVLAALPGLEMLIEVNLLPLIDYLV